MLTTLPPSCAVVMKSGNLNFLETCGPLRVCNGTAATLVSYVTYLSITDVPRYSAGGRSVNANRGLLE